MPYNPFPQTYQPMTYPQQPQQQQQPQTTPQNSPMIWVQGETGAKSYLLAPNTTLPLWDSENQIIYLKSADASGMPSMKILDYTIRQESAPQAAPIQTEQQATTQYVTKEEFEEFERSIRSQLNRRNNRKERKHEHGTANANAFTDTQ